jgi:hypothetical protein
MSTRPNLPPSNVFNPSLFSYESDYLTLADADLRYVRIGGDITANNINCNQLYIGGNLVDVSAISGVTAGIISASKAAIVDANKDITGFRNLTATNLTGTLQTASQPNITSVGTLSQLDFSNSGCNAVIRPTSNYLYLGTSSNSDLDVLIERHGNFVARFSPLGLKLSSSAIASYPLDVVGDISSTGNWRNGSTILMNSSGILQTASQPNITSLGALVGLTLDGTLQSTAGIIQSSSALQITAGNAPSGANSNGIGMRFIGLLDGGTGLLNTENHFLSTRNNLNIQLNAIYVSSSSRSAPVLSDSVCFNSTTPYAKWDFNQASTTNNRLRLSYTQNSVYNEMYCDGNGYLNFSNTIVVPSIGTSTGTLSSNSSFRILGSQGFVSGESLELAYSTTNHQANILSIDRSTGIQRKLTLGGQFTINAGDATIAYGISIGGNPSTNVALFDIYQSSDTTRRVRIGYDQTHYSEMYCSSTTKLTFTSEINPVGINAGITNIPSSAVVNIGSDSSKYDTGTGSAKIMEFHGGNATPTIGYLLMSNGSGSTAANAMTFGTYSTTNINFYAHNVHAMTISGSNQYVGIGTGNSSPAYPLDVYGSTTWSYGGTAYWLKANVGGGLQSGSGGSFAVSLKVSDNILCSDSVANYSDERLKSNIMDIDVPIKSYMKYCVPKRYNRIDRGNNTQLGFIAQSVINACPLLVQGIKNEKMMRRDERDPPDGIQLCMDYSRMTVINCCIIRKLIARIEVLEKQLAKPKVDS